MIRRPPRSTLTVPLFPSTPLFRSLYDISLKLKREQRFAQQLSIVVVAMTLLSALLGIFLSGVAVAPVRDLAMRVRHRRPEDWSQPLVEQFQDRKSTRLNSSH